MIRIDFILGRPGWLIHFMPALKKIIKLALTSKKINTDFTLSRSLETGNLNCNE